MGPELKPFGSDNQPKKLCTGRPRQKRELAVAEASEPAGRNRLFLPKDDSLSRKGFSSSTSAKRSWQHIVAHVKFSLSGSWTRQIILFQSFNRETLSARGQGFIRFTKLRFETSFRENMADESINNSVDGVTSWNSDKMKGLHGCKARNFPRQSEVNFHD